MLLPSIALVGRPNVGKSTLFNRLTGTRDALVADYPGLTRDRLYGYFNAPSGKTILIDTGGITGTQDEISILMARQVEFAIDEADVVIFLVDANDGVTPIDKNIAESLRKSDKDIVLAVNKSEGLSPDETAAEFWSLAMGQPQIISAKRGDRISSLISEVARLIPQREKTNDLIQSAGLRLAVIGRPNVGKSTLINRYLGAERLLASDQPGTTRDSIYVPFSVNEENYIFVDTAGIRRRKKVTQDIEKFSIVKSLAAIEDSDAVILLIDAQEGVTEQDVSLAGLVIERGRALTLGINKWDGLTGHKRKNLRDQLHRRLPFLDFVERHFISALHGSNIYELLNGAAKSAECANQSFSTNQLTRLLNSATETHPPPLLRGRRPKLSYAHQGGKNPPVIVLHGNQIDKLSLSYRRYLMNYFRKAFKLTGTPLRLELVRSRNPFAGRRNQLTSRQKKRRKRIRSRSK
ncbi:MAG: ribosome biogenesis GTPase Der [Pseudomonadota bacterium]|nr:ribosome biogenesis GTPase Der [Pseudomonadota bacterium]